MASDAGHGDVGNALEPSAAAAASGFDVWALVAVATGVGVGAVTVAIASQASRVLGWLVAALVAATLLAALIGVLERAIGHRGAVAITVLLVLAGMAALVFRVVRELSAEVRRLQASVPRAAERLERSERIGRALRDFRLADKARDLVRDLPDRLIGGSAGDTARLAGSRGAAFLTGLVLACFLCAGGRRSFHGIVRWVPERPGHLLQRHTVQQVLERAHRRISGFLLFAIAKAIAVGAAAGTLFWAAHVPGPTILGLFFSIASFVPGVGVVAAGCASSAVLVGLTHGRTLILCELAIVGIVIAELVAQRLGRRAGVFDVGPALGTAAFFAGFEMGGLGTAVCVVTVAAFTAATWTELLKVRTFRAHAADDRTADEHGAPLDPRDQPSRGQRARRADRATLLVAAGSIVVAASAAIALLRATHRTTVLVLIALVVALALDKIIGPVAARIGGHRGLAIAAVGLGAAGTLAAAAFALAPVVATKAAKFQDDLPKVTDRLGDLPFIGARLRDADVTATVQRWLDGLPRQLGENSARLAHAFWGATDAVFAALLVVTLAFAFAIDGPRFVSSVRRALDPRSRRTFDRAGKVVLDVVGRYFAGSLFVAALAGVLSLLVGLSLGILLAPLVAVWIVMTNLIPQVGGLLGGSVLVAAGFATSNTAGVVCLVYFLTYQQIENHIIQPAIIGRAVSLSPAATMLIALIGGSALGVPGALIAVPFVGAARSVVRVVAGDRAPPLDGSGAR